MNRNKKIKLNYDQRIQKIMVTRKDVETIYQFQKLFKAQNVIMHVANETADTQRLLLAGVACMRNELDKSPNKDAIIEEAVEKARERIAETKRAEANVEIPVEEEIKSEENVQENAPRKKYFFRGINLKENVSLWCRNENYRQFVSLWEDLGNNEDVEWTKYVAVQGTEGLKFPVQPSYIIRINHWLVYYLWEFEQYLPSTMMESLQLTSKALAYLAPGSKELDYRPTDDPEDRARVVVPGIPDYSTGEPGTLESTGTIYTYQGLWDVIGPMFPVRGKSLWKYLDSEALYVPGLTTTREFFFSIKLDWL